MPEKAECHINVNHQSFLENILRGFFCPPEDFELIWKVLLFSSILLWLADNGDAQAAKKVVLVLETTWLSATVV